MAEDQHNIQIIFERTDPKHGTYRDALYYSLDEYEDPGFAVRLEQDKLARYRAWQDAVSNPPPPPEPEPVDVEALKQQASDLVAQLNTAVVQLQDTLGQLPPMDPAAGPIEALAAPSPDAVA